MRLLTVPNWSFGRDRDLLQRFEAILEAKGARVHYLQGDVDHNRTVSAFSGPAEAVQSCLFEMAEEAFARVDLNHHVGVHPRIGALDVLPILTFRESDQPQALAFTESLAAEFAARFDLPIYLYEKSERGRHEADLPSLRKGGFGGLTGRTLHPDFGPAHAHPRLGLTVAGVREPLVAMNVDLATPDAAIARDLARTIRELRGLGDPRFLGVRALGFPLASRSWCQVSLNLTLPDLTPPDPIIEWVMQQAGHRGVALGGTELIGVIRKRDLAGATRLPVKEAQIIVEE